MCGMVVWRCGSVAPISVVSTTVVEARANDSAAKAALIAFSMSLTREGPKYNIKANTIVPLAASAMTETVMPPDVLKSLTAEHIAPLVGVLTAKNGPDVGGRIFELGGGFFSEVRWERSQGYIWKTDKSFTPSAVACKWDKVMDFSHPEYPTDAVPQDMIRVLEAQPTLQPNEQGPTVSFKDQTIIITGAGNGLGRSYAIELARGGANVVINDVSEKAAQAVVDAIKAAGGKAAAAVCSATDGEAIVKTALDNFGGLHGVICNAGILRDKAFVNMTDDMWDAVIDVHLTGTFKVCKAAWPIFYKQKYGRIMTTASPNGVYGCHGQCNYATAKSGLIGFMRALAIEGQKHNIFVNTIAPRAGTAMTATVWTKEMLETFKPDFIAPIVAYLVSDRCEQTGTFYETFGGYAAQLRWQRSGGVALPNDKPATPEKIASHWSELTKFDDRATNPTSTQESFMAIMENFENKSGAGSSGGDAPAVDIDPKDSDAVKEAKQNAPAPSDWTYSERDVMLYNLGIGAKATDLDHTYEGADNFESYPTFPVLSQFMADNGVDLNAIVPNFNPAKLLHGEQYLELKAPIPVDATLELRPRLVEVLDKGKAASVTTAIQGVNKANGEVIFDTSSTTFIRGSGGFNGPRTGKDRGAATAANEPPKRGPDAVIEEKTSEDQAALYRLSGDYNPLHIDPQFSAIGGFPKPILHGLCSMGFAGRHVYQTFGPYKDIKVRFAGIVIPGETLVTEMWKEGDKVIFRTSVKERKAPAISNAAVTLVPQGELKSKL